MARILVLGNHPVERQGLALVLEMAGHSCAEAATLHSAMQQLRQAGQVGTPRFDLVLSDARIGAAGTGLIRKLLVEACNDIHILVLKQAGDPLDASSDSGKSGGKQELTVTTSPLHWLSSQFSSVSRPDALVILLPEQDSLAMLESLPRTAGMLNKLAVLYHSQAKFAAAEKFYRQALEVAAAEVAGQADQGEVASILNNLAGLFTDQKRYSDAEPLYLKSLALVEEKYGPVHPKITKRLMLLSYLYRAQGKGAEAEAISRRLIGSPHAD
ncbi:MAG: tetratricopeptide repeat protein [Acidobacteria bacterium]|nr:tetratricopeptide repeat protein [Acidobacteriota bacterium]